MNRRDSDAYAPFAIALHWLLAVALLGQIAFGFLLDDLAPRGTAARGGLVNLHKSIGLVLGALIVMRLAWRLAHRPPALPSSVAAWQRAAALFMHRALYACMVALPISGYVASNFSRHGVRFFGLPLAPWGADLPHVYAVFNGVHVASGWLLTALIALHVLAAAKHAFVDRDAVLGRMWPRRAA